jgi:hypothetical protein
MCTGLCAAAVAKTITHSAPTIESIAFLVISKNNHLMTKKEATVTSGSRNMKDKSAEILKNFAVNPTAYGGKN